MPGNQVYLDYVGMSLKKLLDKGIAWERIPTSILGVFVVLLPSNELAIELMPSTKFGKAKKMKGLIIRKPDIFQDFKEIFNNPKVETLLTTLQPYMKQPRPILPTLIIENDQVKEIESNEEEIDPTEENRTSDSTIDE